MTSGAADLDAIPSGSELADRLSWLAVPYADVDAILAARRSVRSGPARELIEHTANEIASGIGDLDAVQLPNRFGGGRLEPEDPATGFGYLFAFLAVLPQTLAYHRDHGIDPEVSRITLADIGRACQVHRWALGRPGIFHPWWLTLHLRGALYQLGRLQFNRATLGERTADGIRADLTGQRPIASTAVGATNTTPTAPAPTAAAPTGSLAHGDVTAGDASLGVHIPRFRGGLDPAECDESFRRAAAFFARHFPDERPRVATCHSWLLDPALADLLPPQSNIVRFQRRFRTAYLSEPDDASILIFVFGRAHPDLAAAPRDSHLQRVVLDRIAAGQHWRTGAGWLAWPPTR